MGGGGDDHPNQSCRTPLRQMAAAGLDARPPFNNNCVTPCKLLLKVGQYAHLFFDLAPLRSILRALVCPPPLGPAGGTVLCAAQTNLGLTGLQKVEIMTSVCSYLPGEGKRRCRAPKRWAAAASPRCLTALPRAAASSRRLTPLPHAAASLRSLTALPHSAASLRCLTALPHAAASRRCLTPLPHCAASTLPSELC